MWKWLLTVLAVLFPGNQAANIDYVGEIAAHVAYAGMAPSVVQPKPKVPTKDCTTCNGTGRVRTGDSNNPWTKCPDCEGPTPGTGDTGIKTPKSDPTRYSRPE